jgi:hypothetical protein
MNKFLIAALAATAYATNTAGLPNQWNMAKINNWINSDILVGLQLMITLALIFFVVMC